MSFLLFFIRIMSERSQRTDIYLKVEEKYCQSGEPTKGSTAAERGSRRRSSCKLEEERTMMRS